MTVSANELDGFSVPGDLWQETAIRAYRELGDPLSQGLAACLTAGDFRSVAEARFEPGLYNDFKSASTAFRSVELLRKFPNFPGLDGRMREEAARKKADEAEAACFRTNRKINSGGLDSGFTPSARRAIVRAKRKIHDLLPEYDLEAHLRACRHGPGSDVLNRRPYVAPYHKFSSDLKCTAACQPFVACLMEGNHLWARWIANPHDAAGAFTPIASVVRGNEFLTVPKTALTDRSICIEPGANIYLQLGLGAIIRHALRRVGIDLNSQETNRWLALLGSYRADIATIDLSSASDTIARALVQELFDYSPKTRVWWRVMDSLRSRYTNYGTKSRPLWKLNQKFSSMGNGFTFELESLIFWALSSSAAEQEGGECLAVYGDDIIVTSRAFAVVTDVLEQCGFEVNTKKSYNSGYYRESCGMNAWDGYEMPSYKLEQLDNLQSVYSFHNGLLRIGCTSTAAWLRRRIPARLRFYGPSGAGDVVLHSSDYHTWQAKPHGLADQWFFWGLRIRALRFQPVEIRAKNYEPAILHSLSTLVPLSDHTVYTGARWGSQGLVPLTRGVWTIGEILISREQAGIATPDHSL